MLNEKSLKSSRRDLLLFHVLPFFVIIIFGSFLAFHNKQDLNWDLLNYHFYNPWAFIHGLTNSNFAPSQLQVYYNPLLDLLSFFLISSLRPIQAGVTLGAIQAINVFLIYEISLLILPRVVKVSRPWLAVLSFYIAIISFFGAANYSEIGSTMGDNITSIFILLSLYLLVSNILVKKNIYFRYLAFLILGFVVGLKLTNGIYVPALLVVDCLNWKDTWTTIKNTLSNLGVLLIGLIVSYGYWAIYLWKKFRDPLFPYFNNVFHSPYLMLNINAIDHNFYPRNFMQLLFYPFYFLKLQNLDNELFFRDPRFAVVYAMLIVLIIILTLNHFKKKKVFIPNELKILTAFVVVSYITWEGLFSYFRYDMAIEFVSPLLIASLLFYFLRNKQLACACVVIVLLLINLFTLPPNWGRIPWQASYFGVKLPQNYQLSNATVVITGYEPMGFIIPFMPKSTHIIRIQSNIMQYDTSKFNQIPIDLTNKDLASNKNFYLLTATHDLSTANSALFPFNMSVASCSPIVANTDLLNDPTKTYTLCHLAKTKS